MKFLISVGFSSKGSFKASMMFFEALSIMIRLAPVTMDVRIPSNVVSYSANSGEHILLILLCIVRSCPFEFWTTILIVAFYFIVKITPSKFIFIKSLFEGEYLLLSFSLSSYIFTKSFSSFISLHAPDNNKYIFHVLPLNMISFLFFHILKNGVQIKEVKRLDPRRTRE